MNKIEVKDNKVSLLEEDNNIIFNSAYLNDDENIKKINIKVIGNTDIEINYKSKEISKLNFEIEVFKDIIVNLTEIKEEKNNKIQNKYFLEENSVININKFYDVKDIKELDIIYLNGEKSKVNYNFKTIASGIGKYDMIVYHNHYNTESYINNKGVTIKDGILNFNVTSIIYNCIKGCITDQKNRILNLNSKESNINPILLIEENDVIASHSAYIGKFNDDELFYMQLRGIEKEKAKELLIKGFLYEDNKKIQKIIDKYWR